MKNDAIIDKTEHPCTEKEDVIRLMEYKDLSNHWRSFSLYKTLKIDCERNSKEWIYFLLEDDDKYPIIITKRAAEDILKEPVRGRDLVLNRWFDRYR